MGKSINMKRINSLGSHQERVNTFSDPMKLYSEWEDNAISHFWKYTYMILKPNKEFISRFLAAA